MMVFLLVAGQEESSATMVPGAVAEKCRKNRVGEERWSGREAEESGL